VEESQHKGLLELVESQLHAHQIIESFQAHQKILSDKCEATEVPRRKSITMEGLSKSYFQNGLDHISS
jgi:hypothetical protein